MNPLTSILLLVVYAGAASPATTLDAALSGEGDPWTADRVRARILEISPAIDRARRASARAEADVAAARIGLYPSVDLELGYTRLSEIDNGPLVSADLGAARAGTAQVTDPAAQAVITGLLDGLDSARVEVPQDRYRATARATWAITPVLLEVRPGLRALEQGVAASREATEQTRALVVRVALSAWYDLALARGASAVATLAVERAETDLARAEARLAAGDGTEPDVLRFRARAADARRRRAEADAAVASTEAALNALLELAPGELGAFPRGLVDPPAARWSAQPVGDLQRAALDARAEMRAMRAQVAAARAETRARAGGRWPTFALAAQTDYANPNALYVPPDETFELSWMASALVSWSPDGALTASRERDAADAGRRAAEARLAEIGQQIRIEVARAIATYRAAFPTLEAARAQLEAAETGYAARARQLEVGMGTTDAVIEAALDAERAQLALLNAGLGLRKAEVHAAWALGRLLDAGALDAGAPDRTLRRLRDVDALDEVDDLALRGADRHLVADALAEQRPADR